MTATISWNAVTLDVLGGAETVAGYVVYHGNASGDWYEWSVVLAPTTTLAWTGLYDWLPHFFAVMAYDTSNNESAKSAVVSKQIYLLKDTILAQGAGC